jgi:hypothetical protein
VFVVHGLTIIEAECLLIDVPEQVERFDAHLGAVRASLQQAPEILHSIGVDVAVNILHQMVHDVVFVFRPCATGRRVHQ